jgi:surface protein
MFQNAKKFNQPLTSFNTQNVTSLENTFVGASAFNQDVSNWNVEKVTNMNSTFG